MITNLYPNLKDNPVICEKYKLEVLLDDDNNNMFLDMYIDHDDAVEILNGFNDGKILSYMNLAKYKSHYYVEYANYKVKRIKMASYYDFYGRECTVNINKIYDFNRRTLIYSSTIDKVFDLEYSESCHCDFFEYSKSEEFEDYIEFKVNVKDMDRHFFLYCYDRYSSKNNELKIMTFRINNKTLSLSCVEKPELIKNMKVKNI
jgi:hypothetical protein